MAATAQCVTEAGVVVAESQTKNLKVYSESFLV